MHRDFSLATALHSAHRACPQAAPAFTAQASQGPRLDILGLPRHTGAVSLSRGSEAPVGVRGAGLVQRCTRQASPPSSGAEHWGVTCPPAPRPEAAGG